MSAVSSASVVNLFKKVYGDLQNLLPEDYILSKDIPFAEKQKVGEKYVEGVILSHETGITFGGSSMEAFELNAPIAGSVQQAEVQPYATVLPSLVPYGVISRSAGGGERAFYDATKHIVKNNLRSHSKFLEITRLYGQSNDLLGYVSYATATYRGAAFVTGTGTIPVNGTSVSFTNGINASQKMILFAPGSFASGFWVGMEGVRVNQVNSSNVIVASGKLVGVDSEQGVIIVDFTPVAASSTTSHRLCFDGWQSSKESLGIQKILTSSSTLFGISTTQYSLWRGSRYPLSNTKLTFERMQTAISNAVNRGGLEGDVVTYVNPRSWATLATTESGSRRYDSSYKSSEAEQGFENIVYYHQTGKNTVKAHRCVKEGEAFILYLPCWSRSGSAEVSFSVPGISKDIIYPVENQAAFKFNSYSDQYVFCHAPAQSIYISGINDEASS